MMYFRFIDRSSVRTWYSRERQSPSWPLWIAIGVAMAVAIMPLVLLVGAAFLIGAVVFVALTLIKKIVTGVQAVLGGVGGQSRSSGPGAGSPLRVQVVRR